jgi:hypothetical protein
MVNTTSCIAVSPNYVRYDTNLYGCVNDVGNALPCVLTPLLFREFCPKTAVLSPRSATSAVVERSGSASAWVPDRLTRHDLVIGQAERGTDVRLPRYEGVLLMAGPQVAARRR